MRKGKFNILFGGQAGSESKGLIGLFLANKFKPDLIVQAASPNAGHTVHLNGVKKVGYQLPVSALANGGIDVALGPTSVINPTTFMKELEYMKVGRVMIHPRAAIIKGSHIREEQDQGLLKIGSTNSGIGPCRAEKIMRSEDVVFAKDVVEFKDFIWDTVKEVNQRLIRGRMVLCEMTQGFDLDLEHGIHPRYCTSKMINPAMAMAEAGVSPHLCGHIYAVVRPYPIRVNNREGSSGPYADAKEISFDIIKERCGCPFDLQEITTTTHLPRRVFEFSRERIKHMWRVCRPDFLAMTFANYVNWADYQCTTFSSLSQKTRDYVAMVQSVVGGAAPVAYIGTSEVEVIDVGIDT